MWGYIKKIIEFAIFSFLVEGVVVVTRLSLDGIVDEVEDVMKIATVVAPVVMASLAVVSLLKVHRKRSGSRYQKDPISVTALVILVIVAVIVVIGAAVGVNCLANYLYVI